jgi:endonuclease III related protein
MWPLEGIVSPTSRHALLDMKEPLALRINEQENLVRTYYRALYGAWGPRNWWRARSRFEVIVGAYLTQNTAWTNVEKATANLRREHVLSVQGIRGTALPKLEQLIRPSGYFRQKAQRLKTFVAFLDQNYGGSLTRMFSSPTATVRGELLSLHGVGPETADSILLYAGNHASFVVDAYTRRILDRHGILPLKASYEDAKDLFERALEPLAEPATAVQRLASGSLAAAHTPSKVSAAKRTALTQIYNEMHGLIVGVGKNYCKKSQALCDGCPLQPFLAPLK